jgi:hypothetical protein
MPILTRRRAAILLITSTLSACASTTRQDHQLRMRAAATAAAAQPKLELFYDLDEEIGVVDSGTSNMLGMAGIFGFVGLIAATAAAGANAATTVDRVQARSKEFTDKLREESASLDINRRFAEAYADTLRAEGKEVVLTPLPSRAKGGVPKLPDGLTRREGYAALVVRLTKAYSSPDSASSYSMVVVVDQAMYDQAGVLIHEGTRRLKGGPTYTFYASLLSNRREAFEAIDVAIMGEPQESKRLLFEGPVRD